MIISRLREDALAGKKFQLDNSYVTVLDSTQPNIHSQRRMYSNDQMSWYAYMHFSDYSVQPVSDILLFEIIFPFAILRPKLEIQSNLCSFDKKNANRFISGGKPSFYVRYQFAT